MQRNRELEGVYERVARRAVRLRRWVELSPIVLGVIGMPALFAKELIGTSDSPLLLSLSLVGAILGTIPSLIISSSPLSSRLMQRLLLLADPADPLRMIYHSGLSRCALNQLRILIEDYPTAVQFADSDPQLAEILVQLTSLITGATRGVFGIVQINECIDLLESLEHRTRPVRG